MLTFQLESAPLQLLFLLVKKEEFASFAQLYETLKELLLLFFIENLDLLCGGSLREHEASFNLDKQPLNLKALEVQFDLRGEIVVLYLLAGDLLKHGVR